MKFTAKQLDTIREMYSAGASRKEIEQATGLNRNQVYHIIYKKLCLHDSQPRKVVKVNLKVRVQREVTPDIINRIIILTNWGYQCKEIAEDQEIHPAEVRRVVQEAEHLGRIQKKV
jgi:DNA invertase Pin-like site-specific DNA recombinase